MLFLLSPSKKIVSKKQINVNSTMPFFLDKSLVLIKEMQKKSIREISHLMKISNNLAELNYVRYRDWDIKNNNYLTEAFFSFNGSVYNCLDVDSLELEDLEWAQKHFFILSGLYGILRPLDLISPYRLEMGVGIEVNSDRNLYDFWRNDIVNYLNSYKKENTFCSIVNLASNEYFKVIDSKLLQFNVIHCAFENLVKEKWKIIGVNAKRARGFMSRYVIQNKIDNIDMLKKFNLDGYIFDDSVSTDNNLVFRNFSKKTN
ncbi:conserved hypothetical protein of the DUF328 family [Candidatus Kinetoplastibacterium desouzaii TCC079E]|uniref:UPF0246 protein CDSE_0807 n=1 Tax=Candidatus Kinetoplastidibacterium desouzai TCC079E TaxID=1208919 RepID=M1L2T4_9PROT|nr:peroxide stress protein YaaA [Candidatus Kinetoplastibacterium desouzaii]AGF47063.1 conserved hypothetical protein of the DUF328 family [Candidatus Kinetoplastibacterium desouzaii TCC079E]